MKKNDNKAVLLLIASAVIIFIAVLLFIIFDSPKYNSLESVSFNITHSFAQDPDGVKVNINTADVEELVKLKYVGEKKALEIIEYRRKNGYFRTLDELKKVSGINDKFLEENKDMILL